MSGRGQSEENMHLLRFNNNSSSSSSTTATATINSQGQSPKPDEDDDDLDLEVAAPNSSGDGGIISFSKSGGGGGGGGFLGIRDLFRGGGGGGRLSLSLSARRLSPSFSSFKHSSSSSSLTTTPTHTITTTTTTTTTTIPDYRDRDSRHSAPRRNHDIIIHSDCHNHNHNHNDIDINHNDNDIDIDIDKDNVLADTAPPEWALLLFGCLLGLATGLCVTAFTIGVHVIHEWAWAGTPNEGAAWLRLQRLADTWHRILLIPVTGGVIVGMMHGLVEILNQIRQTTHTQGLDLVAGVFPTIKAIQAAVTLGTGCSLGPEGPMVDIGKSCAGGFSLMMESNRERRIALVAAGAAAGIASGSCIILALFCF